jgi:deoxyguanosine kinase
MTVYLLLGSNRGNKMQFLLGAVGSIREKAGKVLEISSVYESEPWGFSDKENFLNQAVRIETQQSPEELLVTLQKIEKIFGREKRSDSYESRTLDIDIVYYADRIIDSDKLKIPHPLRTERRFTLVPLVEIAGSYLDPVFHVTVTKLLAECRDDKKVEKVSSCNGQ